MKKAIRKFGIGSLLALSMAMPVSAQQASSADPVIYLNQAWSQEDREWYYQFSQGSTVLSYDIFLNLEVAGSQELFRSDANSDRYGLIPQKANPASNPEGFPIGIAKTSLGGGRYSSGEKGDWIGFTCAACHEGQLHYKGKRIGIQGGNAGMFDVEAYMQALNAAMQATLSDTAKFDRLAARIGASTPDARKSLRERFEGQAGKVHFYMTRITVTPSPWGPARMDAIGLIVNRLVAGLPDLPENLSTPIAPSKPPFLWNAPQGLWTQWRGVQQDPIFRNLTEVMGVYMDINLRAKSPAEGLYHSNASIPDLIRVENQLNRLAPPQWPEEIFGKIDREKARVGEGLFMNHCASCHNAWPYRWSTPNKYGKSWIIVGLTPHSFLGTDPGQFREVRPFAITGQLGDNLPGELRGKKLLPTVDLYYGVSKSIMATALEGLKMTDEEKLIMHGYREYPLPRPLEDVYKAAPRDGVWATPPFMHNGSVPNLYEMFVPAKERTKKFYVGREFDPVKVGLDTSGASGKFLLDTELIGNSNAGHSFEDGPLGNGVIGPLLTENDRWALVEYLKSIPDQPGRVTPFGGPPK
jgi:hypothetical protein